MNPADPKRTLVAQANSAWKTPGPYDRCCSTERCGVSGWIWFMYLSARLAIFCSAVLFLRFP